MVVEMGGGTGMVEGAGRGRVGRVVVEVEAVLRILDDRDGRGGRAGGILLLLVLARFIGGGMGGGGLLALGVSTSSNGFWARSGLSSNDMRSSAKGEAVVGTGVELPFITGSMLVGAAVTPKNVPESICELIESLGFELPIEIIESLVFDWNDALAGDEGLEGSGEATNAPGPDVKGKPREEERLGSGLTSRMNTPRI